MESGTILLAEDNESLRVLVAQVLRQKGYRVLEAASGGAALEIASRTEGPIDLVLSDLVMPGMTGRELWDRLLQRWPAMRAVFMSSYGDGPLAPGAAFLQKPFTLRELVRIVETALSAAGKKPVQVQQPAPRSERSVA